jgi:tRNA-2-methylthio-N6-dimethylallyladenosine synthase
MTGCNNFCSYCAVPYVRGREVSRSVAEVLSEIKKLAEKGCLEVTLLGQNVNAYKPPQPLLEKERKVRIFSRKNPYKHPFAALLWEVNKIPGIRRIFFTAPHPKDMDDQVIDALTLPKMMNYLHLPVQAGDDTVLRKMNRHYTAADYLKLVDKIKKKKPGIALGTDIIVGFPGETKKAFQNTVELYKKANFDIAYLAMYSPRQGTMAEKLVDDVPQKEKKRRRDVLQNLMEKIVFEKNQKYVGKIVSVLVDEYKNTCPTELCECKVGRGWCIGNSREMKRVRFAGKKNMVGKIFNVKIKKAFEWILEGEISPLKVRGD